MLHQGGALGATYVNARAALIPKIGAVKKIITMIIRSFLLSLPLEHYGNLGVEVR
ncbi:MAG: uncharacterized membrane protein YdcZ (DUF606 family) [Urechidicola sp.]|jgi:uncharacterized membrane protein YdcZ (DUF606 family)